MSKRKANPWPALLIIVVGTWPAWAMPLVVLLGWWLTP